MGTNDIDSNKLNEALDKFGSLQKAIAQLESDKLALEKKNTRLKQENDQLSSSRDELASIINDRRIEVASYQSQLESLATQIESRSFQYGLFCGFMAMVAESPSVTDSISTLITLFQTLKESERYLPKNADEMRSLFVHTVIGDYLKCFRCTVWGAKFMVNKEPPLKTVLNYYHYQCPSCRTSYGVEPDDSFLKAMVSEKQLKGIRRSVEIQKENDSLKPFKIFFNIRCEVCGKPVAEWTDRNIQKGISGLGWGHTQCWDSPLGQAKQMAKLVIEKIRS
jgi:hypothetical protein